MVSSNFGDITYFDYLRECDNAQKAHPEWRWGQTLYNIAFQLRPEETQRAQDIGIDPFYKGGDAHGRWVIDRFLDHMHQYWNRETKG